MPISFDERLDLLQRASRGWLELKKVADTFNGHDLSAAGTIGQWSAADVLIHVATWDEELTRVLLDLDSGEEESWPVGNSAERDAWNEARVAEFRSMPLGDARDLFDEAHFDLMEVMEGSPSVTTVLVEQAIRHYAAHLADLRALKRQNAPRR